MTKNDEQSQVVLVFGRKGTGKTSLMRKMIKKIKGQKTILIIDLIDKFDSLADYHCITAKGVQTILENNEKKIIRLNTCKINEINAAIICAYYRGNVTIVMDECDNIFGSHPNNYIREIILRGRNQGIDLILSSLRPYKVNIDLRNQADIIYCFPVVSKEFLKSMVQEFGEPELFDVIYNLKNRHDYVRFDIETSNISVFRESNKKKTQKV